MKRRTSRLLSILLALCMVLSLLPGTALAARGENDVAYPVTGGNIYFDAVTGTITDCGDYVTAANIPNTINGVAVTGIGARAFADLEYLKSVTIPDSVTTIGDSAFIRCTRLTGVTIPDSVTTIEDSAFEKCTSLASVIIGNGVTAIKWSTFRDCTSLASVIIGDSVTTIGDQAFRRCSMASVTIPDGVTTIGSQAFNMCGSLKTLTIPDSVTTISNGAFYSCSSLTDVYYSGTESQWNQIDIQFDNDSLLGATIHYAPEICTVTFHANGGTVSPTGKTVTKGEPYGTLPTPVRSGHTFIGWYISVNGVSSWVTSSTTVTQSQDHTLYAAWKIVAGTPCVPALTYSFSNGPKGFAYETGYRIPLERFQLMFGDTALAQTLYEQAKASNWSGGTCYGMSTTASLFFVGGNGVSVSDFKSGATLPSELSIYDKNNSWNLTVRDFIEAMQISASGSAIQRSLKNNKNQLDQLCRAVNSFRQTGTAPVVIYICGPMNGGIGAHAIVGYDIVNVSTTESRLMVYDCNYPKNENRYITLAKNSSGQYTGWYYHLNNAYDWGSGYSGSMISYYPYSDFLASWNDREGADKVNLLTINAGNAVIKDVNGSVVASIRNGEVVTNRDDVCQILEVGITADGKTGGSAGVSLWLPTDDLYTVTNTDPSVGEFEATLVNVDQSAAVVTTASEVILGVSDDEQLSYAQLPKASGDSYTITLISTLEDGYQDVQLTGTARQGAVALAQMEGNLYGDVSSDASLQVDGAAVSIGLLSDQMPDAAGIFGGNSQSELSFADVPRSAYYYDAVVWATKNDITYGMSKTKFEPDSTVTRAQAVTFLYRAFGNGTIVSGGTRFSDVEHGSWFENAVAWAVAEGITIGTSKTAFSPYAPVTYAQMLTFLARASGEDISGDDWESQATAWASSKGVFNGIGSYNAKDPCPRRDVVYIMYRAA